MPSSSPEPVAAKPSESKDFDLGSWQTKLSSFASNPSSNQHLVNDHSDTIRSDGAEAVAPIADLAILKVEWHQFLEHVARKTKNFMATHLQSCELVACSPHGVLDIACCRKFSYEELQQERAVLQQEISEFYALPLQIRILYDAEKDACTKEKTVFTLFQELSQQNEVVRFLVTGFGGELVY
ncbi:MAG: DNA polymerase III subunit gamma/tau [Chlorobium sp.]|nr:DNA polymerase III subunit gamma/tau [Chlorobium sp.]